MQRRKHRLLIFFLSYIPLCTLHAWVQRCLWGPLLCQSGVWCLLGHAVIVLLRQKPKKRNTRVDSAVTDGWKEWEKGWRGSMCVCVCLCVRTCVCVFWFVCLIGLYCGKSWTDGSTLPEGATEQKPGSHEFKIFTITSVTSWPLRKTWSLNHLQKCK